VSEDLNYYSSLVDLLGSSPEDLDFTRFVDRLGERPLVDDVDSMCFYYFLESGIEILALRNETGTGKFIYAVTFFMDSPPVREMKPYRGQFIAGVTPDDSLKEVMDKINVQPIDPGAEVVPRRLRYDYPDHTLDFVFREPDGEQMLLVSINVGPA
jgi:hypothetical protein